MWKEVFTLACVLALSYGQVPPINETCLHYTYPPPSERKVPTFVVDLDLPGEQRWTKVAKAKSTEIKKVLVEFKKFVEEWGTEATKVIQLIDDLGPEMDSKLPQPYRDEIKGIAAATGLQIGEVTIYNIFYEIFTVCTSIIAQDPSGNLFHARNLDFGLFIGWDVKNRTWEITEVLRPTIVNIEYQKGGKTLYKAVHFAGYIGILTAVKPGLFSLSMDERFKLDGGYIGILEWLVNGKGSWMGFLTRDVMETAGGYEEARVQLSSTLMLAPAYFILGGNQSGQACVITRNRSASDTDFWYMTKKETNQWYILETNYDHWSKPLFLDDRRTPANKCMQKLTQQGVGIPGIYDVLNSKPVRNKLTTYSALMQVNTGHLETWLQYCDDTCMPW